MKAPRSDTSLKLRRDNKMKKIGFIDYYLSEWHANNYPAWIKGACEKLGADYKVCYAYGELEVSPVDGVTGAEWCEKNDVEKCESIEEVCEKSDVVLVLCPSNPEKHLEYAKKVLPYGKRTYIDKTFTPDYAQAEEIFNIGKKYNTPFFSTSALRYAKELDEFEKLGKNRVFIITGGGGSFEEYCVHQIEMLVKLTDSKAKNVEVRTQNGGKTVLCTVYFENGDIGNLTYAPSLGFTVSGQDESSNGFTRGMSDGYFQSLIEDIINFYETGKASFEPWQTLECMRIREMLLKA